MRIKRGTTSRRKHKKLLEATKGYRGAKRRLIRTAKQAELHAGSYAYHGRKRRKRDMRRLWITRISQASAQLGIPYSKLINKMQKSNIALDRKVLSDIIVNDNDTFKSIVEKVKTL